MEPYGASKDNRSRRASLSLNLKHTTTLYNTTISSISIKNPSNLSSLKPLHRFFYSFTLCTTLGKPISQFIISQQPSFVSNNYIPYNKVFRVYPSNSKYNVINLRSIIHFLIASNLYTRLKSWLHNPQNATQFIIYLRG
jgi:hypothetical protein